MPWREGQEQRQSTWGSILSMFHDQLFTHAGPECAKRQSSFQSFLAILGSVSVKAAQRMLIKLTPERSKN